jgi:hypothetical protein
MKLRKFGVIEIGTASLLLGGLLGCGNVSSSGFNLSVRPNVEVTKISDLKKSSPKSTSIYIEGEVGKQAPFLDSRAYEVKDGSGSIWVVTKEKMPKQKDKVLLKGIVQQQNIRIGGKTITEVYIKEQQRL